MNKEKLIPKLRFEGFENNEWIPYKLKNIVRFSKGRGYSKNDLLEQGSPIILYGRMYTNYEIIIHNVDTYAKPKENTIYSEGTEVIVPSSGETAEDIARASFVSKKGIILGGDLNIMHLIEEHNPFFLALSISNGDRKKELIRRAQGSSVVHLYNTDLENAVVYFPTLTEQNKIGCFLKKIDEMIQLQKSKVNKVKDIKSAYLSEMFPKEGEKYPKKRFEGFTKPWKLTKFNEIADVERGLTYHPSDIVEKGGVRVLRSSNIDEDTFITKDDDVFVNENAINIEFSQKQNILITSANGSPHLVGKHAILEQLETPSVHGGFMLLARTASPYFLNASMSSDWYRKFIRYHVAGGGGSIGNIKKSDLEHQLIYIPSKEEQEKIGQFFKNLDNQISIEEEKLAKLEKLKQAYLHDMFV